MYIQIILVLLIHILPIHFYLFWKEQISLILILLLYIFLKIHNLKIVLEWAERIVGIAIARTIVVAIASVIVAIIVIASPINARIIRIAIGFDLSPV